MDYEASSYLQLLQQSPGLFLDDEVLASVGDKRHDVDPQERQPDVQSDILLCGQWPRREDSGELDPSRGHSEWFIRFLGGIQQEGEVGHTKSGREGIKRRTPYREEGRFRYDTGKTNRNVMDYHCYEKLE